VFQALALVGTMLSGCGSQPCGCRPRIRQQFEFPLPESNDHAVEITFPNLPRIEKSYIVRIVETRRD